MTNTTTTGSKVGRARRRLSQLWQVPMFLVGAMALAGVAASAPWRQTPQARELDALIAKVRAGLESGEDAEVLIADAEKALIRLQKVPARACEVHFLVGSVYYRQAKEKTPTLAKEVWPRATQHLEEALLRGPSDEDRVAIQYRLGFSLYQQNKQAPRALELMTLSVEKGAEQPLQGYRLLVEGHLKQKPANLDGAVSAARRVIDLTPEREIEAVALARIQLGELLLRQEKRSDAIKELGLVSNRTPRALRIKGRLLQAQACEEDAQWAKAIAIWNELLADAAYIEGNRARILYAIGLCHQQKDPPDVQEATRAWDDALKHGGPAGQAAGLRLGQAAFSGPGGAAQALSYWKTALAKVNAAAEFNNPYVGREVVRAWMERAMQALQEANDVPNTQAVAELYRKIDATGKGGDLVAEAAEALARHLAEKPKADGIKPAEVAAQFRRAADAFEQAAKALPEAERPDRLWRSAQCYLAAKDAAQAQRVLTTFVKIEKNETRLAEGWFMLGDLYRSEGNKDSAKAAYHRCIEIPNTLFANRARYHLAVEEVELKNFGDAHEILKQILHSPSGEIDRRTQEKALYKLATLLMQMKNFGEAHIRLKECMQLYPENPNVLLAREQFGECCRRLAELELGKEVRQREEIKVNLDDKIRLHLEEGLRDCRAKRKRYLTEAVKAYHDLADELAAKKSPNNLDQILLRRAWFGIGECHLDGDEIWEALRVFQELQGKHRGTLEGFFACLRICDMADAIRQTPQQAEQLREMSLFSVRLLLEDLKAMPAEHELFRMKGVVPRAQWLRWAEETERRFLAPLKKDQGLSTFP